MEIPQELRSEVGGMTPPPDRFECQPADWADPPDPDVHAQMWADEAPRGWKRCAKCGDEWGVEDDHQCGCEREDEEPTDER